MQGKFGEDTFNTAFELIKMHHKKVMEGDSDSLEKIIAQASPELADNKDALDELINYSMNYVLVNGVKL